MGLQPHSIFASGNVFLRFEAKCFQNPLICCVFLKNNFDGVQMSESEIFFAFFTEKPSIRVFVTLQFRFPRSAFLSRCSFRNPRGVFCSDAVFRWFIELGCFCISEKIEFRKLISIRDEVEITSSLHFHLWKWFLRFKASAFRTHGFAVFFSKNIFERLNERPKAVFRVFLEKTLYSFFFLTCTFGYSSTRFRVFRGKARFFFSH